MDNIERIYKEISSADKILIGASNGLSIAEGIHIFADNDDFKENFSYYRNQLGIPNIINGCFFPYETDEERWGFYSAIYHYFNAVKPAGVIMNDLLNLVSNKKYFVVTSNIDAHFIKAGFDTERIFEIEGNCCEMQCSKSCHNTIYSAEELLVSMFEQLENGKTNRDLIPKCRNCGGKMKLHIETDSNFVKDKKWRNQASAYHEFCTVSADEKIVLLELGVGPRNQLIKQPFMNFTYSHSNVTYITFNRGEVYIPHEITEQSIAVDANISDILQVLARKGVNLL